MPIPIASKKDPRRSSCVFLPADMYKGAERLSKRTPENSAPQTKTK